jgi:hypothetical protein
MNLLSECWAFYTTMWLGTFDSHIIVVSLFVSQEVLLNTVSLKVNWTFISWVFFIFKRPFVYAFASAFKATTTKQMFSYVKNTIYFWWAPWQFTFATRFWRSSSWLLFFAPCFSELHCSLKTMNSSIHLHYSCE